MLRKVLSVLAALAVGGLVIGLVQGVSAQLYPAPEGVDWSDAEQVAAVVAALPLGAKWMIELSYALGCLAAGAVAGLIAKEAATHMALIVGLIFMLMGFINLSQVPTPLWLAVLTTLTYVPASLAGAQLIRRGA